MILSTVCYIEKDNKYLMLHRTKKENDVNKDKWIGVGGKFEVDESPEECILREVMEETGLMLLDIELRCIITYVSNTFDTEYMYVFTSNNFEGKISKCGEGDLEWIDKDKILNLNIWEGDKIFLEKINNNDNFFTAKFIYENDNLVFSKINSY